MMIGKWGLAARIARRFRLASVPATATARDRDLQIEAQWLM
jgi:hypothetical protein